jgi:hypothetical protein
MALNSFVVILAGALMGPSVTLPSARPVAVSEDPGAGMYCLSRSEGAPVYLSWLQPRGERAYRLLFASLQPDGRWSQPGLIAEGTNWFINQSDRPSIEVMENGSLLAHWLVKNGGGKAKYGYGLEVALSEDGGRNWQTAYRAGLQNTEDYTGFLSFLPGRQNFGAAYLSPPEEPVAGHLKTLRFAEFGPKGKIATDVVVDADVCTCCPTATVMTRNGPVIAYRDHQPGEMRDISVVRRDRGKWLPPQTVSADEWQIHGCPSDGPALAAKGERLAVAWFTRARDIPQIKVAFSTNSGHDFAKAVRVDASSPVGRADVQLVDEDSAVVSWVERSSDGESSVCVRRVSFSGRMGDVRRAGRAAKGRSAGFPKIRLVRGRLLVVWKGDRLYSASIPIPPLN